MGDSRGARLPLVCDSGAAAAARTCDDRIYLRSSSLLSRAFEGGDEGQFGALFSKSAARCLLFLLPCTIAMLLLAPSGLNFLYGRGAFTSHDVGETALCLCSYAIGLVPYSLALLFTTFFHARKEYRIPMQASLYSVVANIALNALFVFVFDLGAKSIAIATSLSSVFQILYWAHARFLGRERRALLRTWPILALYSSQVLGNVSSRGGRR